MGRPKIKDIETAIDLEKVELPKESEETPEKVVAIESENSTPKKKAKTKSKSAEKPVEKRNKTSKRFEELLKLIDKSKDYTIEEAVELIKKTSKTRFDSTIEAHINLQIEPSKQEHQIRTTATLPKGNGKKVTVLVFGAKDPKAAKEAGAIIGTEETLDKIEKGKIDFEKVVASPEWMPKLAKVAKVLGPKGLMPNPKSGTVSGEPEKVAESLNSGLVEIKTENSPIVHVAVGKSSFSDKDLEENIKSLIQAIKAARPTELKKELIGSIYLTSTMGPSVKVTL